MGHPKSLGRRTHVNRLTSMIDQRVEYPAMLLDCHILNSEKMVWGSCALMARGSFDDYETVGMSDLGFGRIEVK